MWRFVVTLVVVIAPLPVEAQRNLVVAGEQRVALVVGNSAYKDAPLSNPVNDATDMAQALQQFGFKVILKRNAGTREMRQAIREFGAELRRAQVGLFYFAGHGVQLRGDNYLIPVGADIETEAEAEDLAVNTSLVLRTMEEAQVGVSIVILDACRNNPFARSFRSSARGLAHMSATTGSLIAFATAPGSIAADGVGRNGTYTKHLLASLTQRDSDILKVFQRTRAGVVRETAGRQTPWESTSLIGDFHFRPATVAAPAPAPAPAVDLSAMELTLWESIKGSSNVADLKEYLDRYPSGQFVVPARERLAALSVPAPQILLTPSPAPKPGPAFRDCAGCPEMVNVPPGIFLRGSPDSEPNRVADEGPQQQVTISYPFAVGKYEITFDEWDACALDKACNYAKDRWRGRGKKPVVNVSWQDAKQYTAWLSQKTGKTYRLLTEAEWEYAARAGTRTAYSWGETITPQQANAIDVGTFRANAFGLHDMHGNVREWVEDCYLAYIAVPTDGSAWAPVNCPLRVMRGGAWSSDLAKLRAASRERERMGRGDMSTGFRVARSN
jgi:formylglycine-generating enzyme required for sulfatase activity